MPHFLEIQDVPTFYRPTGKTKKLNDSFNRFVYKFYRQSILILEEYLLEWSNANLINSFKYFLVNFMKNGCQLEKEIESCYLKLSHTWLQLKQPPA